jgi:hypothetical protein
MKPVVDTNRLVAAYFVKLNETRTQAVGRFGRRWDVPWVVPPPVLIECRNVFAFYSGEPAGPEWTRFRSDLEGKLSMPGIKWEEIVSKTEELCDRFGAKARLGTMDLMILACALKTEATHFLSFDTGSSTRALAAHLKLNVFPDLTPEDKRRTVLG